MRYQKFSTGFLINQQGPSFASIKIFASDHLEEQKTTYDNRGKNMKIFFDRIIFVNKYFLESPLHHDFVVLFGILCNTGFLSGH